MKKTITLSLLIMARTFCFSQTGFQSLDYLYSIQGQQVVSGQHNDQKNLECGLGSGPTGPRYWTDQVYEKTGKYPALWGGDFLWGGSEQSRWEMIYEAENQWNSGAIVNIMWHTCTPLQNDNCNWSGGILSDMNAAQWNELLTDGTNLNNVWKSRVDEVAGYLQYLEDAGVEVFWRPYHEQNQTAFWWNSEGAGNTNALFRMLHNYMTNDLGLSNLIWVWDIQDLGTGYANHNPGDQYWDMMALDIYSDAYTNSSYYNDMLANAGGKPIAIGECFRLPSAQDLLNYPQYTFFMNWAYGLKKTWGPDCFDTNSDPYIREVYDNPRVITLDEMPGWGNQVSLNLATNKNVTASSTESGLNTADNVNDRNINSRWSSEYTDDEWIAIDLENKYALDSIRITWEAAFAMAYEVQVSSDGTNWTAIQSVTGNTQTDNFFILNKPEAQHIRVLGISRATEFGYSIYEIEVYGQRISTAYSGTPVVIPAKIEAEDYDLGGPGVAYYDASLGNQFTNYRTEDVDLEGCDDIDGGFNIGSFDTGEWLNYSIEAQSSGDFDIELRVATEQTGTAFHLELEGEDVTGSIIIPATGGWQVWQTVSIQGLSISEGMHKLTLVSDANWFNVNYIEVNLATVTSIGGFDNKALAVFPNPSASGIYKLNMEVNEVDVHDLTGQLVFHLQQENINKVDLHELPIGTYIARMRQTGNQRQEEFLLIKN